MDRLILKCLTPLLLLASLAAGSAQAAVNVRVEGRPPSAPIQAFVRVTDGGGLPITNLAFTDFAIAIDGVPEVLTGSQFNQPQEVSNQSVSVVFVMDYTSSVTDQFLPEMQAAVTDFINAMEIGDRAAIVKFNTDSGAQVIQPFTEIDGGANQLLVDAVAAPFPGNGSNILDGANLGVQQFAGVSLPEGPKAVILVTDGRDFDSNNSQDQVVAAASSASIPIFTIGLGNPEQIGFDLLNGLADETGGEFFDATDGGNVDIAAAYESVRLLLTGEYLIEIPNAIADCATHQLQVTVQGETVTVPFTRRQCDTEPSAFNFAAQADVNRGATVTSNTVTITGLTDSVPAHISVIQGLYSIGCNGTFTADPATIADGQTVCVQQQTASTFSTSRTTTLTIGGVAGTFMTTTRADPGDGGGGGGGGGMSGLFELLLLGLFVLLPGRRRAT